MSHDALEDDSHIDLEIARNPSDSRDEAVRSDLIRLPFVGGPFDWRDYSGWLLPSFSAQDSRKLCWFPWRLARRDRGVLYQADGVRLEALDYIGDSMRFTLGRPTRMADRRRAYARLGFGSRQELSRGQPVTFVRAKDQEETDAFLKSIPQGPPGRRGQLVRTPCAACTSLRWTGCAEDADSVGRFGASVFKCCRPASRRNDSACPSSSWKSTLRESRLIHCVWWPDFPK